MGFWSNLAKIGSIAGSGIATGLTGGAASPLLGAALSMGSGLAGSLAQGMEKGRGQENASAQQNANFALNERQGAEQALENRAGIDLKQRQFAQDSQTDAYKKALISALGMNAQDVTATRPAGIPNISFSGGLRPSALGAEGKGAAEAMNKLAMQKLLSGEKFDAMPGIERTGAPQYKKPGFWENALGTVGAVGGAYEGTKDKIMQQQNQQESNSLLKRLLGQQYGLMQPGDFGGEYK